MKGAEKAFVGKCCVSTCEEGRGKVACMAVWVGQGGWGVAPGAVIGDNGLVQLRKGPQDFGLHPISKGSNGRALSRLGRQEVVFQVEVTW